MMVEHAGTMANTLCKVNSCIFCVLSFVCRVLCFGSDLRNKQSLWLSGCSVIMCLHEFLVKCMQHTFDIMQVWGIFILFICNLF